MAIENSIVGSYQKVEDTCVEKRFTKKAKAQKMPKSG